MPLEQVMVPGIVGISTYVDWVYHREIQLAAVAEAGTAGPINQLRVVMATLDFNALIDNLHTGRLAEAEEQVAAAADTLAAAGADFIVVTSGTTSTLTGQARRRVSLRFLDLAEAACAEVASGSTIGLLSTSHAAAGGIFQAAAHRRDGTLLLPPAALAARLDELIFGDLVRGHATDHAASVLLEAITDLAHAGADSVILGNTDMTLVADRLRNAAIPVIDSAQAHARASARAALAGSAPGLESAS